MKKSVNAPVADTISRAVANHIQKKLSVSKPGDSFEQEADRVADRVMSMPEPNIQRYEKDDEEDPIQMSRDIQGQPVQATGNEAGSGIESGLRSQRQAGTPLSRETGRFMESRFGTDFRDVKVHTDSDAVQMSKSLGANAFTTGRDIYFNEGKFNENSQEGRHLLSHELTHVVQQEESEPVIQRDGPAVRLPTLEAWAIQSQDFLSLRGYPLTLPQISLGRSVFESSIDFSQVRITETPIINAPTTFGNTIRIAPGSTLSNRTLIHELGHIWQYQTMGSSYISSSVTCQLGAIITTGDRGGAYNYKIIPGQRITAYGAEQQASIIEDYFANPALQSDPEYQRLIGEVRSASPSVSSNADALRNIPSFMPPGPAPFSPLPGSGSGQDSFLNPGGSVPQFQISF